MALYVARLETFTQDFYVERVQLHKLVNEAVLDHKRFFIRNFVYPEVKINKEIVVESDAKWLQFLVGQLISNAIKYSAGSREKIIITAYEEEKAIILEVRDYGVGIPKQDVPRVFQPFLLVKMVETLKNLLGWDYILHTKL